MDTNDPMSDIHEMIKAAMEPHVKTDQVNEPDQGVDINDTEYKAIVETLGVPLADMYDADMFERVQKVRAWLKSKDKTIDDLRGLVNRLGKPSFNTSMLDTVLQRITVLERLSNGDYFAGKGRESSHEDADREVPRVVVELHSDGSGAKPSVRQDNPRD